MKPKFLIALTAMALIVIMSSFAIISYQTNKTQDEFRKQLGITEKDVKIYIQQGFFYPSTPNVNIWKKAVAGSRAALVISAGNYTKQYVTTPAFEKEYKQYRDGQIKANTPAPALTREQIAKKKISENETAIQSLEKTLKTTTNPDTKKACEQSMEYLKKRMAEFKSGKSAQIDYELKIDEQRYNEAKKLFDEWMKDHPETVQELIKQRLNEFLALTKGIDYNAVYVEGYSGGETGGEGRFKNPVYNHKSSQWMAGFFAGKEITETARTFIQQWLKELN
jgi:hypothetical protein